MERDTHPGEVPLRTTPKPVVRFNNFVRKHTHGVDLETLNQQGITKVKLLTFSKINELIALAVQKALEKYGSQFDRRDATEVQEEVREEIRREVAAASAAQANGANGEAAHAPPAPPSVSEILERRIEKLRNQLQATEAALERALTLKGEDEDGVSSIYREVQGLKLADQLYEKKKGMLKVIFEENYQLQKAER
jgi:hypothetical protein